MVNARIESNGFEDTKPKECLASLKSFCRCYLKNCYTWGLWILQPVRRHVLSIQESLWIAGERSLWRFVSLPWRLTWVIGWGLGVLSSRGIRWRRGLMSWISASLTRRTVVTTTGTGRTNLCPPGATGSISHFSLLTVCLHEVIACLHDLIDFTMWRLLLFGFILSSILIHTT